MTHLPTDDMHRAPRTRRERNQRSRQAASAGTPTTRSDAGLTMPLSRAAAKAAEARLAETPPAQSSAPDAASRTMPLSRTTPRARDARATNQASAGGSTVAAESVSTTDTRRPRHTAATPSARGTRSGRRGAVPAEASTRRGKAAAEQAAASSRAASSGRGARRHGSDAPGDIATYLKRTLAALVLPGGGFVLTGLRTKPERLRLGVKMAALYGFVLVLTVIVALLMGPTKLVLAVASRTPLLIGVLLIHLVAIGAWCASIVLTGRDNRPTAVRLPRYFTVGWISLLCAVLIAPTATAGWVGHTTLASMSGIHYDFGTNADGPNGTADNPWAGTPRVNVLILGSDAGEDRYSFRTDAMMVASIDTTTGKTALFGIPRQLQGFTLRPTNPLYKRYGAKVTCSREQAGECMLNAMPVRAVEVKDQFPVSQQTNAGIVTLTEILEDFLNLNINNTIVMQMRGLTDSIEALGGVTVNVKQRLPIGGRVHNGHVVASSIHGWIEPGLQRLNGEQAKWYARSRATTDNDDRMNRQRCLVGALVKQITPAQIMASYSKLTQVLVDNIKTDIDLNPTKHNGLPAWLALFDKVRTAGKMTSVNFIDGKNINTTHPDYDAVHAIVRDATTPAEASPSTPQSASTQPTESPTESATASPTPSDSAPTSTRARSTAPATEPSATTPADVDLSKGC